MIAPAMIAPARLSFSVVVEPTSGPAEFLDLARRVEDLDYSTLFVTDHLSLRLAPIPALTAAAMVTDRIQLGTYVLNCDLRNAAVTAREMLTLHAFSSGRAVLGVGAGWAQQDYTAARVPLRPGPDRLAGLRESLAVIRSMLDDESTGLPLLVGGSRRETLTLAGLVADEVSILPPLAPDGCHWGSTALDAAVDGQIATVLAAAAGRDDPPRLNYMCTYVQVTDDRAAVIKTLSRHTGCTPEQVLAMPSFIVGSAAEITETLLTRRERWGLSSIVVPATSAAAFAPVMAALRDV